MDWRSLGAFAALCALIAVGGIWLCFWVWSTRSFALRIHDNGFEYQNRNRKDAVLWRNIRAITEYTTCEKLPLLNLPLLNIGIDRLNSSYMVTTLDGKKYEFTPNSIEKLPALVSVLRRKARDLDIPWEVVSDPQCFSDQRDA